MARPLPLAVKAAANVLTSEGSYKNPEKQEGKILKWLKSMGCDNSMYLEYAPFPDFQEMFGEKAKVPVLVKAYKELTGKEPSTPAPPTATAIGVQQQIIVQSDSRSDLQKAMDEHKLLEDLRRETGGQVVICSKDESHLPKILEYYRTTQNLPKVCPCCHTPLVAPFGHYSGFDGKTLLSPTEGGYINLMTGVVEPADKEERATIYAMIHNLGIARDTVIRNIQSGNLTAGLTPVQITEIEGTIPTGVVYRRQGKSNPLAAVAPVANHARVRTPRTSSSQSRGLSSQNVRELVLNAVQSITYNEGLWSEFLYNAEVSRSILGGPTASQAVQVIDHLGERHDYDAPRIIAKALAKSIHQPTNATKALLRHLGM